MSKTVVLIHGAWLTPAGWDYFKSRYEAKGFAVVAEPWPFMDAPIEQLRASPDPRLKKLTVDQIVDHYVAIIDALPESPIIIGHSFGGLITELLLDRGLGVAGVALDPALPAGVVPPLRMLASAAPIFAEWEGWDKILTMSFKSFAETFANTLPETEMQAAYDTYIVPCPGRIYWQDALGIRVGLKKGNPERAPLLLTVGEKDITVTPGAVKAAFDIQKHAPALTEFKEFPGRSHFLFHEPGWEEVADFALDWAVRNQRAVQPAS
ncbi:MAG: alpha/beta fold hydrolase [Alphaproteobacteria bacterium]|nr:alpha/beta fold hydrolase [Alphaproteobacteria bacterium]